MHSRTKASEQVAESLREGVPQGLELWDCFSGSPTCWPPGGPPEHSMGRGSAGPGLHATGRGCLWTPHLLREVCVLMCLSPLPTHQRACDCEPGGPGTQQPSFLGGAVFTQNFLSSHCCCSVTKSCPTLCDPMDYSTPGFPVLHQLLELAQTHVH